MHCFLQTPSALSLQYDLSWAVNDSFRDTLIKCVAYINLGTFGSLNIWVCFCLPLAFTLNWVLNILLAWLYSEVSWLLLLIFSWSLLIENAYLLLIVRNIYFICFLPQVEYKRGHEERISKFTSVVDTPDILHAKVGAQLSSDVSEIK